MGIRKRACKLVSKIIGVRPPIVVSEVKRTALSLSTLPLAAAVIRSSPSARRPSIVMINTMESFTTIPASPKRAIMERIVKSNPINRCPSVAPIKPKGMISITAIGRLKLPKTQQSTIYIKTRPIIAPVFISLNVPCCSSALPANR